MSQKTCLLRAQKCSSDLRSQCAAEESPSHRRGGLFAGICRDWSMLQSRLFICYGTCSLMEKGWSCPMERYEYPFAAIVGQEKLKTALLLNLVDPRLGGVLIQGEKGTAKSTAVRGLAALMDEVEVTEGCPFHCRIDGEMLCDECRTKPDRHTARYRRRVVELPVSATEDRVVGTLDLERALKEGVKAFEPGLLAQANGNILYVDEINLLEDHIVDVLLDSAAMGVNTVEREGVSYSHPARFILVGTMNPEEGDLRPQLLDRFGLMVEVHGEPEAEARKEVVRRRLAFETDPAAFCAFYEPEQEKLRRRIAAAQNRLSQVALPEALFDTVACVCTTLQVDGHRADITMLKTARALAALDGRQEAAEGDLRQAAELALPHRLRRAPFEQGGGAELNWGNCSMDRARYPFSAVVGQERAKQALLCLAVEPRIGGVLLCGEKGTAKSTLVRAMGGLEGVHLVELPVSTTEDMLLGGVELETAVRTGRRQFQPGLLARADGAVLYADEINLLPAALSGALLDTLESGVCRVERDGISHTCPARFSLVGTMNPEEGILRPQLLDRFGIYVAVIGETEPESRKEVVRRALAFETDPVGFCAQWAR